MSVEAVRGFCRYAWSAYRRGEYWLVTIDAFAVAEHLVKVLADFRNDEVSESHRARLYYLYSLYRDGVLHREAINCFSELMSFREDALYSFLNGEIAGKALDLLCMLSSIIGSIVGVVFGECCGETG